MLAGIFYPHFGTINVVLQRKSKIAYSKSSPSINPFKGFHRKKKDTAHSGLLIHLLWQASYRKREVHTGKARNSLRSD